MIEAFNRVIYKNNDIARKKIETTLRTMIMYGIFDGSNLLTIFETELSAQVGLKDYPRTNLQIQPIEVQRPLDPEPWRYKVSDVRAKTRTSNERHWEFEPRRGFEMNSEPYGPVIGGLDPTPYLLTAPDGKIIKGKTRYAEKSTHQREVFSPREGYSQNEIDYVEV